MELESVGYLYFQGRSDGSKARKSRHQNSLKTWLIHLVSEDHDRRKLSSSNDHVADGKKNLLTYCKRTASFLLALSFFIFSTLIFDSMNALGYELTRGGSILNQFLVCDENFGMHRVVKGI
jgi:hypothetical protein